MPDYITPEGMQRLQKKIQALTEERPLVLEQIQVARAMGDLSENAEYHAAREKQRNLDNELGNLTSRLNNLKIIDPTTLTKDTVKFGALIKIKEKGQKQELTYHLVGPDEVYDRDDDIIQVSYASPLGKAMLGKKPGEEFIVDAPRGKLHYKVIKIS